MILEFLLVGAVAPPTTKPRIVYMCPSNCVHPHQSCRLCPAETEPRHKSFLDLCARIRPRGQPAVIETTGACCCAAILESTSKVNRCGRRGRHHSLCCDHNKIGQANLQPAISMGSGCVDRPVHTTRYTLAAVSWSPCASIPPSPCYLRQRSPHTRQTLHARLVLPMDQSP